MGAALQDVKLSDKYTQTSGRIFISGTQALARLPILQRQVDARAGLNTGGFISGYRGSPIGGYDATLWQIRKLLEANNIVFNPGVNEDLAATSVAGTQQFKVVPDPTVDGVFAIWYGKGPGVDRSLDAIKHGNYNGTDANGGVLLAYGDDHPGKSSSVAHQSEQALASCLVPSLYPAGVAEYLDYGLLGFALSRYSGLWVGMKCVNETIEQTATVDIDIERLSIARPETGELPAPGVHYAAVNDRLLAERIVVEARLPLVHRFVRANGIDRVTLDSPSRRLGIVTAGKSWQDVVQALALLGIDEARAAALGVSVYKVGCIWPLEPEGIAAFAAGQDELLVVEEKKAFLEEQAAAILYNLPERPRLTGKRDADGAPLLSSIGQLEPLGVALAIARRLEALGIADEAIRSRVVELSGRCERSAPTDAMRTPFFCSGCPHNTSTRLPDGSYAMGGIGCHAMAVFYRPNTIFPTQMGGEGSNWIGIAPFTQTKHVFQNLGDGTYYHSGLMAIRAAVAAGVNITYKILYNDAVAMTGGQPVDGPLSVGEITHQVLHEGVRRCVLVSDHPEKFNYSSGIAHGVEVYHRDELERVQRELREVEGCTVLVYEQTCAAEKRRRRKKGQFPDPAKRLFINDAVCEGCADCSTQSNCVSLLPLDTAMGRKRQIDQSNCNKDYSCVKGFCPSFVTVYDAQPRKPEAVAVAQSDFAELPQPPRAAIGDSYGVMIAGIGGTGVITVGAVLGMAAHLEGRACSIFDMTGLSQKNGAVYSHLKISEDAARLSTQRLGIGEADLLLGFDMVSALGEESFTALRDAHTEVVGNSRMAPTALFQFFPDLRVDEQLLVRRFRDRVGEEHVHLVDASGLALALCGDTIATNLFLVGFAAQKGLLPLGVDAIEQAVRLNGVAVDFNLKAFNLGRLLVHDADKVIEMAAGSVAIAGPQIPGTLEEIVAHRAKYLAAYQNDAYAARYRALVERVAAAERERAPGKSGLAEAVARYYAKLLAYKDEYEVARLYAAPEFLDKLKSQFDGEMRLAFNLAPPLFSARDPVTGQLKKREYGAWMLPAFRVLSRLRFLRGTPFDIFGYTAERREERRLIADYEALVGEILGGLGEANHATAVQLAQLPETIRGFGHVKERHIAETRGRWQMLLERFRNPAPEQVLEVRRAG